MTIRNAPAAAEPVIVARAGRYYRNTRYIMAVLLVGLGVWFAYDGWIRWPAGNRRIEQLQRELTAAQEAKDDLKAGALSAELKRHTYHNSMAILFQKVLAFTLPPLGIGLLAWALYNSRGEYRLVGDTLAAPGHPPVSLGQIRRIDRRQWDRKGIAYVHYHAPGFPQGQIKLDDFVYDRPPIDQIFERVERAVSAGAAPQSVPRRR